MDNKALGIKILKSTALFTVKAAWFLLCKACLAVLLIMGFIVEAITSRKESGGETTTTIGHIYDDNDLNDPHHPINSSIFYSDNK
jgi:hypothetical protein